jgi:hypothetical protein
MQKKPFAPPSFIEKISGAPVFAVLPFRTKTGP